MGLSKLIKNRISKEWKDVFNSNVDYLERLKEENQTSHKATNKRIDNLVLSSGGDSPNEVTDARSDTQGNAFETLKGRLDSEHTWNARALKDANELIAQQRTEINRLNGTIEELYGSTGGETNIYVSAERGNDKTADGTEEKPFKTIQSAIYGIPFLSTASYYLLVEPGVYFENVIIEGINAKVIEIVGSNNAVSDATKEDTGVFVRSICYENCKTYCRVRGITQTDPQNSMGYFIYFIGSTYGAIDNCRAVVNTKSLEVKNNIRQGGYRTYVWERCIGNVYNSAISNQKTAISALFGATVRSSNNVYGSANELLFLAEGSFIFVGANKQITGTKEKRYNYGGQVFKS